MTSTFDRQHATAVMSGTTPDIECSPNNSVVAPTLLWLDITRSCQLACGHCYNSSGPAGGHGTMSREDWFDVLDQAGRIGVGMVQLIGGEPTMHPHFPELLNRALSNGLNVEVYSNLVSVKAELWELFTHPGVSLATSYYSDNPEEHNAVTGRDSHRKTRANIIEAVRRRIPLRVGIVGEEGSEAVTRAEAELRQLGVTSIGIDRVRHFGRGQRGGQSCDVNELCGNCGDQRAAIGPDGTVTLCIMASWLTIGNVKTAPLADILAGEAMTEARSKVPVRLGECSPGAECRPDAYPCQPQAR